METINYYNAGVKAQKAGNFTEAEDNYQKALLTDPYNTNWQKFVLNNRGAMLIKLGDFQKAEASLNDALKIDPNYKPAQINLGFTYEKRRTRLESLEYWAKVFDIDNLKPKDVVIEEGPGKKLEKSRTKTDIFSGFTH
jgi:tetratricopeptide (TPR) repeat protein